MKTLSIIIPTFNEEEYLPLLLESIKQSTFQPLEVIVADAGSLDRTRDIAREFGARVVDGGLPGPGRNRGAKVANGDVFLFLDADVILQSDFLERSMSEFEERGIEVASPDVEPMEPNKLEVIGHKFYNWYVRKLEKIHPHGLGFCLFATRELHKKLDGFDETVTFCEDHDYALRGGKVGKFRFLSTAVPTSTRRFERDGRVATAIKYILAEFYIWIFGPIRNNLFNYTFGHKKKGT